MDCEQYIGCIIIWKGRPAQIVGFRSCYDGDVFLLSYCDGKTDRSFPVEAFDRAFMRALPDPGNGLLKFRGDSAVFLYKATEYTLGDHPYEPCLYIKKDGEIIRTLHYAFTVEGLQSVFAEGRKLHGINGKDYSSDDFCRVLAATLDSTRTSMDFPFAARLVKKD